MRSINGTSISGDRFKAQVRLELDGLKNNSHYVLGDRLKGRLLITPHEDMVISSVSGSLKYAIKGKERTVTKVASSGKLNGGEHLVGGKTYTIPLNVPYAFDTQNFTGRYLRAFWVLSVFINYDPNQFQRSVTEQVLDVFRERNHGTAFDIPVRSGSGAYQARARTLSIPFLDKKFFMSLGAITGFTAIFGLQGLAEGSSAFVLTVLAYGAVAILLLTIAWHYLRLESFQMIPLELQPLRDGQLRIRALDRGNGQLEKARIGYRFLESHLVRKGNSEGLTHTSSFQQSFAFAEVARRKDHLYEAVLPWPKEGLPPTITAQEGVGFGWELFLEMPQPLGGTQEETWPITVDWEPFRLPEDKETPLLLKHLSEEMVKLQR